MPSILEWENLRKMGNITRNSKTTVGNTICSVEELVVFVYTSA